MNDLVDDCGSAKIDMAVNVNQTKQNYGGVEKFSDGNYDFVILEDFISDKDELSFETFNQTWANMFEFFDKGDQIKKLFKKYKFLHCHV